MNDDERFGTAEESVADTIKRLAKLSSVEFGQVKATEAEVLGCTVGELTADWKAERKRLARKDNDVPESEVEPWEEPVDGDALLNAHVALFRQYVVIEDKHLRTTVLWAVHTHAMHCWDITPRLAIGAPKKRSGKPRTGGLF